MKIVNPEFASMVGINKCTKADAVFLPSSHFSEGPVFLEHEKCLNIMSLIAILLQVRSGNK